MSADLPIQMFPKISEREPRFLLLLPVAIREHIAAAAKAGHRTRTAEIVMRLAASMENESIDEHGCIVVRSATPLK